MVTWTDVMILVAAVIAFNILTLVVLTRTPRNKHNDTWMYVCTRPYCTFQVEGSSEAQMRLLAQRHEEHHAQLG